MKEYMLIAREAASGAAELLNSKYSENPLISDYSDKDVKTEADKASQELIINHLKKTDIPILAEESSNYHDLSSIVQEHLRNKIWIVDPLDGTMNFTRGFKMAAVSIALWEKGEPVLGVVHDINHNKVYWGSRVTGAWCDDMPIKVSTVGSLNNAILATGFPTGRLFDSDSLRNFISQIQVYKKIRMIGSAALSLAYVAAGNFDVYEEEDIYIWDVAAGLAIVSAAGGHFSMEAGLDSLRFNVTASNRLISSFQTII